MVVGLSEWWLVPTTVDTFLTVGEMFAGYSRIIN